MPRLKNSDVEEREGWVLEQFRSDPRISAPKMNAKMKDRYKSTMRAKRIYELRDVVLEELGWSKDQFGSPTPPKSGDGRKKGRKGKPPAEVQPELNVPPLRAATTDAEKLQQANRTGEEQPSLFSTWIVPAEGIADAVSFQRKLNHLRDKGGPRLKVDSFTERYVVVSLE